ncbi:MAG: beta-ketoacyl-[acyl-carrier-protein] synthase family protein, partial [Deltaproteobacteria bacterium]|nr:beta-ketoacyl-[acyl-carrier-protein] synthase family protein [Deltaproteobacteria bacterium]
SPLGASREEFTRSLLAGRSGAGPIRAFDARGFACRIAAEVPPCVLSARCPGWELQGVEGSGDRKLELGLVAAHDALDQAGLLPAAAQEGGGAGGAGGVGGTGGAGLDGISLGTGLSSVLVEEVEREIIPFLSKDGEFDHQLFAGSGLAERWSVPRHLPGRTADQLARICGIGELRTTHFSACAASAHAIGQAARWVARGLAERVLAGGMDSMIHPFGLSSFVLLGTLTTRNDEPQLASRPFDRARDGFLLGEGAAMLVVEALDAARARGAPILAEILGFGTSVDAWQVTAPHPEGRGAVLAMQRALDDAGLQPEQVGYVNAHGTGTPLNDPIEIRAFRQVFGPAAQRCPISSTKSMHGHLIAAAGAIEACALLVALAAQRLPPTINVSELDPECQADVVPNTSRPAEIGAALSNSFGFGGQNGCLVLGRVDRG